MITLMADMRGQFVCFRKTFMLEAAEAPLVNVLIDGDYWMWVNGGMTVFDGGIPYEYSHSGWIDIKRHVRRGKNVIAILTGKDVTGFEVKTDFDGSVNMDGDDVWKMTLHPAYRLVMSKSDRLTLYDKRLDPGDWVSVEYDDSGWTSLISKDSAPCSESFYIPPLKDGGNMDNGEESPSGLREYENSGELSLPRTLAEAETIVAKLPYNAQVTPYLSVTAPPGRKIKICSDIEAFNVISGVRSKDYFIQRCANVEYITAGGADEEFEAITSWVSGHEIRYSFPAGVTINAVKYRETCFDSKFPGVFRCESDLYNSLWNKARRTTYVCIRKGYMDCPDRERVEWVGDVVNELHQAFYSLESQKAAQLTRRFFRRRRFGRHFHGGGSELPMQTLAAIGKYGLWSYFMYTDDAETVNFLYPHIKNYLLNVYHMGSDGLMEHYTGDWDWADWGEYDWNNDNIDIKAIENCWYYLALDSAVKMADLTGNTGDQPLYIERMEKIRRNFNRLLWDGEKYLTPASTTPPPLYHVDDVDDRANALAVICGLAEIQMWPAIKDVLMNHRHGSPFMEKFILEALYIMGYPREAMERMGERYAGMVNDPDCTTLWETWNKFDGPWQTPPPTTSYNHGWSGGPLTLLSQYTAGVKPELPGYESYHIFPMEGGLNQINAVIPTVKGNIEVEVIKSKEAYSLKLVSPPNTNGIVGIPLTAFDHVALGSITVNGICVWRNQDYAESFPGITPCVRKLDGKYERETDSRYVKFNITSGCYDFQAYPDL